MSTAILVNGKEIDYSGLPDGLRGGMGRYLEYGVMPGHFLSAILANDLRGACGRPYDVNRHAAVKSPASAAKPLTLKVRPMSSRPKKPERPAVKGALRSLRNMALSTWPGLDALADPGLRERRRIDESGATQ